MAEFLQSWEDRIPMGVVLNETEEAALKVMKEVFGIPSSTVYDGIQYAILAHRYKEIMHDADQAVFQSGEGRRIRGEELSAAEDQIARLAAFIMKSVPNEPQQNEGAGECAVRIIKELQDQIKELRQMVDSSDSLRLKLEHLRKQVNRIQEWLDTYGPDMTAQSYNKLNEILRA